ncbi:MAG: hypothetical protein R3B35_14750 [Gemmatimonadales bacterium]
MNALQIGTILGHAALYGAILPVVAGGIRSARRRPAERAALMWMAMSLAISTAMWVIRAGGNTTSAFMEFSRPLYLIPGLYAFGELTEHTSRRAWIHLAGAAYLLFWGWRLVEQDYTRDFGAYSGPALNAVLALGGLAILWERITARSRSSLRDFGLLIGLGAVISYAPPVALEAVSFLFYDSQHDALMVPWALRGALLNVGLVLYTLAFLWTIPPRSSSGSSPSRH